MHSHDDEVSARKQVVQGFWPVQLANTGGWFVNSRVNRNDSHAELGAQTGRFSTDAPDSYDYQRGVRQMDCLVSWTPLSLQLSRDINV